MNNSGNTNSSFVPFNDIDKEPFYCKLPKPWELLLKVVFQELNGLTALIFPPRHPDIDRDDTLSRAFNHSDHPSIKPRTWLSMREEYSSKPRYLGIMDICNQESSESSEDHRQNPKGPTPQPRKRHHSPEPKQDTKPKRRRPNRPQRADLSKSSAKSAPAPSPSPSPSPSPPLDPSASSSPEAAAGCHSRKRHNLVEQKYRQRLNSQFKQLLDILPTSEHTHTLHSPPTPTTTSPRDSSSSNNNNSPPQSHHHGHHLPAITTSSTTASPLNPLNSPPPPPPPLHAHIHAHTHTFDSLEKGVSGDLGNGSSSRRVSKGEVLDRARTYIQALEREHERLVAERRELDLLWEGAGMAGAGVGREYQRGQAGRSGDGGGGGGGHGGFGSGGGGGYGMQTMKGVSGRG